MKRFFTTILLITCVNITWAAPKTVTLSIPTMDCPVCPITIKQALLRVVGVSQASVNFEKKQAVVTFDDTKANIETLTLSTKNAGYPSTLESITK